MSDTLKTIGIKAGRKLTVESREKKAAEFFKDWKISLRDAQKRGLWRWQFKQREPVSYRGTKAATTMTKAIGELGYKAAWVPRVFEKNDPQNPFGEFLYIEELRVWWHSESERVEPLTTAGGVYWEGTPRENNTRANQLYEAPTSVVEEK